MIKLSKLCLQQGAFVLSDLEMTIRAREYCILMGPTGCGKTTLVEAICGLRRVTSGQVWIDSQEVTQLSVPQRRIGYVPQDVALFPTMRVKQQIQFAMQVRKYSRSDQNQRTAELAQRLEIEPLLDRYPSELSGGEKQRVALARALSFRPKLLCLDEPLSALDGATRDRMIELLAKVHRDELVTVMHITHNAGEGQKLGTQHYRFENGCLRLAAC